MERIAAAEAAEHRLDNAHLVFIGVAKISGKKCHHIDTQKKRAGWPVGKVAVDYSIGVGTVGELATSS
jgi:hypothetical protein